LLYLYYGYIFSIAIGKKRYPFEAAYLDINVDNLGRRTSDVDLSKKPEFLLFMGTLLIVILLILMESI